MTQEQYEKFERSLTSRGYQYFNGRFRVNDDGYFYRDLIHIHSDGEWRCAVGVIFSVWDWRDTQENRDPFCVEATLVFSRTANERMELSLLEDQSTDIDTVEKLAQQFYSFCVTNIPLSNE